MKNLKLSFALVVAIAAVGFTVATKANFTGKKVVTACYELVTATNAADVSPSTVPLSGLSCQDANTAIGTHKYLKVEPTGLVINTTCEPQDLFFCCAQFEIADPADPRYADIPEVDLDNGDGLQKWVIVGVKCRATE